MCTTFITDRNSAVVREEVAKLSTTQPSLNVRKSGGRVRDVILASERCVFGK